MTKIRDIAISRNDKVWFRFLAWSGWPFPLTFPAFALSLLPSRLPGHPALLDAATGEAVSYPAFLSRVRALVRALRSRSRAQVLLPPLARGDVAFVLAPARLDVPVLYLALLAVGVVVSPANPALTAAEVSRLVSLCGASVAFAVSSTAGKLPAGLPTVLLDSPRFRSLLQLQDEDSNGTTVDAGAAEVRQSDTAAIQYSSGTTGRMKAVALPHRSLIAMLAGIHALRLRSGKKDRETSLVGAPMFHTMGFISVLKGVALGLTTVLMTEPAGLRGMLEAAERWQVTEIMASPPVVLGMTRERRRLPSLEKVSCGGAPLPVSVAEQFRRQFPQVDLCMGYGSTEVGGISLMIDREECSHIGSVGRVNRNVEVKVVDIVTSEPLSVGQTGELCVRGPSIMTGYVGDDEANAAAFDSEGWLKTGDLCYIDQDGFLFMVDRLKELIKYKGYQVPPAELELVLQSLPGIVDAAVVPYPDQEAGQIPMALVVRQGQPSRSQVTEAQVMEHVAKQVAPYKKIRKVVFVDSIPRSPVGKILRRQLLTDHVRSCHPSRL